MFLRVDYINNNGAIALVRDNNKIAWNINQIPPLAENFRKNKPNSFITVCGRWIFVYQSTAVKEDPSLITLSDHSFDITIMALEQAFSQNIILNIKKVQQEYKTIFNNSLDTVYLTYADCHEEIIDSIFSFCNDDDEVLLKAQNLGVKPIVETLKTGDAIRVTFADEKDTINDRVNVYAVVNFGNEFENSSDNGFAYLKFSDLLSNYNKIETFIDYINKLGVKFDRASLLERFTPERYN